MADTLAKLAYDESVRTLSAQAAVLDNLRARAGTLIATASLVTSFLGGQALAKPSLTDGVVVKPELGTSGAVAILLFILVAVMAIAILWPYTWRFDTQPSVILTWPADDYEGAIADQALFHEQNHASNAGLLDKLFWCLRLGFLFLVGETVAWVYLLTWE